MAPRDSSALALMVVSFLSLSAFGAYVFVEGAGHVAPWVQQVQVHRIVDTPKGAFAVFDNFWHNAFLDELWSNINVAFIPSTMELDPISWWQMFSFLTDCAPLYAIWVLESNRLANKWTTAYFPVVFASIFQIVGGCIIGPFYYIGHALTCPLPATFSAKTRTIEKSNAQTLLLSLFLTYYTFYLGAYLGPSNEFRHWFLWLWQMFPFWISLSQVLLSSLLPRRLDSGREYDTPSASDMVWVRLAVFVPGLFSALVWTYTFLYAPYPLRDIMLPKALVVSRTPLEGLRNMLQWDAVIFFTAFFLWLLVAVSDLHRSGLATSNWPPWLLLLIPLIITIGPGASASFAWLVREEILDRGLSKKVSGFKKPQ